MSVYADGFSKTAWTEHKICAISYGHYVLSIEPFVNNTQIVESVLYLFLISGKNLATTIFD